MGKIVCLMGQSASGKDTVYKRLLSQDAVKLKKFVTYTTRPIRAGEQDGVEYYFTDENEYLRLMAQGRVIESRVYNTVGGDWRYFTADDMGLDLSVQSYIMITTLASYIKIRDFYGEDKTLPVMIELDDGTRLQRALDREKLQDTPVYAELCRRFLADARDFSPEKQREAGITRTFNNSDLEQCITDVIEYLRENIAEA